MHSNRHLRRCSNIVAVAVALYFAPFTGMLHAQTPFYQGKTLTVINGNEPGDTADQRMRAVLPFFKKHIPGSPTVVAEYMPGGGGRKVANHIYGAARPDGLTMAFPPGSFITYAVFKETGVNYDINKLIFVGSPESATQYVFLTRKEAGLNSLDKLKAATGIRIGAQSVGHTIYIVGRLFAHVLRLKEPEVHYGLLRPGTRYRPDPRRDRRAGEYSRHHSAAQPGVDKKGHGGFSRNAGNTQGR